MKKLRDFTILIVYCTLIYWLSAQHTLPTPKLFSFQDKILHAGAYFVMSLLAWRFFRHFSQRLLLPLLAAVGLCSFYGMSDEWHQSFVVGRSSDILDWLADTVGAIFAMIILYKFRLKPLYWVRKKDS